MDTQLDYVTHPDFPHLNYYPSSGNFRWTNNIGRIRKGAIAGCIDDEYYIIIGYNKKTFSAHRLAHLFMMGVWPPDEIDHEDGNPSNNRWSNLKPATSKNNNRNRGCGKSNKSGKMGVFWSKRDKRWIVTIGRNNYIGRFLLKEDAIKAREEAEKEHGYHPNHGREL